MRMTPLPHQIEGAKFLAARKAALLADAPRVGKTGAAIMACDIVWAERVLVVTTASGRPVWVRGFHDWSSFTDLSVKASYGKLELADRMVVSWSEIAKHEAVLARMEWDVVLLDESHYAKNRDAKRTKAVYTRLHRAAQRVWCLTGTPIPNAPNDLYPMLRALDPDRLARDGDLPNVQAYDDFLHRYCVVRKKQLNWNTIDVVVGGKNVEELRDRLAGFWLRRTQQDVGILPPVYDLLPIHLTDAQRRKIEAEAPEDWRDVLDAADTGETKSLDLHLGTLRRVTGWLKAAGVAQVVKDELADNDEKIVLMCWHKDVMDELSSSLSALGVVRVDGATSAKHRQEAIDKFQTGNFRVFIGQVVAAGEAIDLSAAAELIFVESSFVPKDMAQAALRITNHGQKRQPRVRVAALEGSIDEALQAVLLRKVKTIKETLK